MKIKQTKGLVLYQRAYKEEDRLVKIFTKDVGKRMFFIKKSHHSRLASATQPLVLADFVLRVNRSGLSFIDEVHSINYFKVIHHDIFKLSYATYLLALTDAVLVDCQVNQPIFSTLVRLLDLIENGLDHEVLTLIYEVQLLSRFGVSLNFNECLICHKRQVPFDFSYQYSGLLCPNHYHLDPNRLYADPNLFILLNRFQHLSLNHLGKISLKTSTKKALRQLIDGIYDNYVGLHLKSKSFLDDLDDWGNLLKKDS